MKDATSYRRILKSSAIIGGASVINILIGLVRTKIIAVMLGPAGIGIVSLYTSLMATASTVASMGIGHAGTRQIAEALSQTDERTIALVRRSMIWGALLLATAGTLVVWSLRELLSVKILGNREYSTAVGWLAVGVGISVASASQGALMQGMRRIGDMARLSVFGSALFTVLGVAVLAKWEQSGLVTYVLISPLISFVLGHWYVSRLPKVAFNPVPIKEVLHQWQTLLRQGIPFMGAGLVGALVNLWIRVDIGNTFGADSLGHFQAASTISMQYIGFVLAAMGADYYPRLTSVIHDHKTATRLVNEQTEIALLISAPIFIAMIALAPWIINMLYSSVFLPAAAILSWQIFGDILKVASFPLGYVLVALGASKTFFWTETFVLILMGSVIAIFSSTYGLQISGIAFLICYLVYLPWVYWLAKQKIGFKWTGINIKLILIIFTICTVIALINTRYWWGSIVGVAFSLIFMIYAFSRVAHMSNLGGPMGRLVVLAQKYTIKL